MISFTSQKLYISNFPVRKSMYDDVVKYFRKFGKIRHIKIMKPNVCIEFSYYGIVQKIIQSQPLVYGRIILDLKAVNENKIVVSDATTELLQSKDKLMCHILNLKKRADEVSTSVCQRYNEDQVYKTLNNVLNNKGRQGIVYPFGSRTTGLAFETSDLDIFYDGFSLYKGIRNQEHHIQKQIVVIVSGMLEKNSDCINVNSIPKARIPIVTFVHKPTGLHCDISFKNGLSCQNTRLINYFLTLDYRVKPLILFLKDWSHENQLHGPPLFSSYSLTMLLIFYLQQTSPKILPSVAELQRNYGRPRVIVGGWDCSFSYSNHHFSRNNKESLIQLIHGFFKFYAEFDYSKYIVCTWLGLPVSRVDLFELLSRLPENMYSKFLNGINISEDFSSLAYPLCVLDPFELNHNVTKGFTDYDLKMFVVSCENCCELTA